MDIDLVYLWVDGNDPVWLTKKNEFLPADRQVDPQVAGECRYVENDELIPCVRWRNSRRGYAASIL